MFDIFKNNRDANRGSIVTYDLSVGKEFPFGRAPQGGTVSLIIDGILTHVEFMNPIDAGLMEACENKNITRSLYIHSDIGWPVYVFVFEPGRFLTGMLCLTDDEIRTWTNTDTNGVHIVLVDARTNKIKKFRTMGLDPDYRLAISEALLKKPNKSAQEAHQILSQISTIDLTCEGRGWLWSDERGEFFEVKKQGLRNIFYPPDQR